MRSERGQILVLTAVSTVMLLGALGLAVDAGYMLEKRARLFAAADAAARTAAIEVKRRAATCDEATTLQTFANHELIASGFNPPTTTTVSINCPPTTGPFAGNRTYVEVVVSETTNTFFTRALGLLTMTPGARAVAGSGASASCLSTLDPSGHISVSNPVGVINAIGCGVADAGDWNVTGTITADSLSAKTCSAGCGGPPPVTYPAPTPTDPLANLPAPSAADCNNGSPGTDVTVSTSNVTLTHGTYHNITFNATNGSGVALHLAGGIYCITGTVSAQSPGKDATIRSDAGVLIYIGSTGRFNLNSNAVDVNLTAQVSGTYSGIIFYQDRTNTNDILLAKNTGPWVLDGAIYAPAANVSSNNANFATSNHCGLFVVGSLTMDKPNLTLDNTCNSFGGSPLQSISLGE